MKLFKKFYLVLKRKNIIINATKNKINLYIFIIVLSLT